MGNNKDESSLTRLKKGLKEVIATTNNIKNFTGADVAVKTLKQLGIKVMWGIPGDVTAFFEALSREPGIEFIAVRHEQEGAFAAQGQAIVTGKPAVVYGSLGPGATNLTTGVANAYQDRTPMIVLVDQLKKEQAQDGFHQYIDLTTLFTPICKKVIEVDAAENISKALREAYQVAMEAKNGPVVVILREDVLTESVDSYGLEKALNIPSTLAKKKKPIEPAVKEVKDIISKSKSMVAILGPEILKQDAGPEVQQFLEKANIPFFTTFMAKGVITEGHPLCLGAISRHFESVYSKIFSDTDTILTIGFDPIEGVKPSIWEKGRDKKVVHIDEASLPIRSLFKPDVEVTVPLKEFFSGLNRQEFPAQKVTVDLQQLREDIKKLFIAGSQKTAYIIGIMEKLRYYLPENAIVVSDVGNHKQFVGVSFEGDKPVIFPNGLSSIGFALSASMGMKKALKERPVIAVHGDGGFLLNSQAMETIKRQNLGVIVLLLEDESYGMIRSKQAGAAGINVGVTFSNPDFKKLTESFGWDYRKAENLGELEKILLSITGNTHESFNVANPTVIHMPVSYEYDPAKPSQNPLVEEENKIRELVRYFVGAFSKRPDLGAEPAGDQETTSNSRETNLLIREFLRKSGKMDWSIVEDLSSFRFEGRMKKYPGLQAVRTEMVIRYLLEFFDIDFLVDQMTKEHVIARPNPEGPSFDWTSLIYRVAEYPEVLTSEKVDFLAGTMHHTDKKVISRLIGLSKDDPALFLDFMAHVWLRCQGREWIFYFTKTYCPDFWVSQAKDEQKTLKSDL